MWKAAHGPATVSAVRDFGCPHSHLSDVNEKEVDGEGFEAAVKTHPILSGCYCSYIDVNMWLPGGVQAKPAGRRA